MEGNMLTDKSIDKIIEFSKWNKTLYIIYLK